jgi:hypothetical protein
MAEDLEQLHSVDELILPRSEVLESTAISGVKGLEKIGLGDPREVRSIVLWGTHGLKNPS